jgi:probable rRNA maturation factor
MHKIRVVNAQNRWRIDEQAVRAAALAALERSSEGRTALNIVIMDNAEIRKRNQQFLDHDFETDVLAFRYGRRMAGTDGEVLVSVEQAHAEARERGIGAEEELLRYVVHGVLHYLGYRDKKPKEQREMFRRQEDILKELKTRLRNRDRLEPGEF